MVRLFVAYLDSEILTNAKCIHIAFEEAVVNTIPRNLPQHYIHSINEFIRFSLHSLSQIFIE